MIGVVKTRCLVIGTPVGIALAVAVSAGVFLCADSKSGEGLN